MKFPIPLWKQQGDISYDGDILGSPSVALDKDNNTYFAASVRGHHVGTSITKNNTYDIVIGKLNPNGDLVYLYLLDKLNTLADETQPALVVGNNLDIFLAYTTRGDTFNNFNMRDVPTFCPEVCVEPSYDDIVLARVNVSGMVPYVEWVLQNGSFNSCNSESNPSLAIDGTNGLLYFSLECVGSILCNPRPGITNVVMGCYTVDGLRMWVDGLFLSKPGQNKNPVVACDNAFHSYIAYETTVNGLANQIEVVRYTTNVSPIDGAYISHAIDWRSSATATLTAFPRDQENPVPTICKTPWLACDARGNVYVAYTTDGVVQMGAFTIATHDLVIASLDGSGARRWIRQGTIYNRAPYVYIDAFTPYLTFDSYGNLYCSLITQTTSGYNALVFKLGWSSGEPIWAYTPANTESTYNAYCFAKTNGAKSVLPTSASVLSRMPISVCTTLVVAGINCRDLVMPSPITSETGNYLLIAGVSERLLFENFGAFSYIDKIKSGCACQSNCSC